MYICILVNKHKQTKIHICLYIFIDLNIYRGGTHLVLRVTPNRESRCWGPQGPRGALKGLAHKGPGGPPGPRGPTSPQGPGPQGPRRPTRGQGGQQGFEAWCRFGQVNLALAG